MVSSAAGSKCKKDSKPFNFTHLIWDFEFQSPIRNPKSLPTITSAFEYKNFFIGCPQLKFYDLWWYALRAPGDHFLGPGVKKKEEVRLWCWESVPQLYPALRKTSEMPSSRFQAPLSLRAIIAAQVQSAKIYAKPTKKEIKNIQSANIYHNTKPTKVYVV